MSQNKETIALFPTRHREFSYGNSSPIQINDHFERNLLSLVKNIEFKYIVTICDGYTTNNYFNILKHFLSCCYTYTISVLWRILVQGLKIKFMNIFKHKLFCIYLAINKPLFSI